MEETFVFSSKDEEECKKKLLEESSTFCMLPWLALTTETNGDTKPCCVGEGHELALGSALKDRLLDIFNSDKSKELRLKMLNGTKSPMCQYCYKDEEMRGESYRISANREWQHHFSEVMKTRKDGSIPDSPIRFLDLRLSNKCNHKCRICDHAYSTHWYKDHFSIYNSAPNNWKMYKAFDDFDDSLEQIKPHLSSLERILFAGGEPLIIDEHYKLLESLIQSGNSDVHIFYNTNFSVLKHKNWDSLKLWKEFKNINLMASLDGYGARGELLRKGQKWSDIESNRNRLREECPHVNFGITATVSAHNIIHLPDFFEYAVDLGFITENQFHVHFVIDSEHSAHLLTEDLKDVARRKSYDLIDRRGDQMGPYCKKQFEMVIDFLSHNDFGDRNRFISLNQKLDEIRGEDMFEIFPELSSMRSV